jgi:hypothetical protein
MKELSWTYICTIPGKIHTRASREPSDSLYWSRYLTFIQKAYKYIGLQVH